jgi:hypothetical protein
MALYSFRKRVQGTIPSHFYFVPWICLACVNRMATNGQAVLYPWNWNSHHQDLAWQLRVVRFLWKRYLQYSYSSLETIPKPRCTLGETESFLACLCACACVYTTSTCYLGHDNSDSKPLKISNGPTQLDINPTHAIHLRPTRRLYGEGHQGSHNRQERQKLGNLNLHHRGLHEVAKIVAASRGQVDASHDSQEQRRTGGDNHALITESFQRIGKLQGATSSSHDGIFTPKDPQGTTHGNLGHARYETILRTIDSLQRSDG